MDDWYDPNYGGHDGFGLRKCKVIDIVNQKNAALWCQIPDFADGDLFFAGWSFGQLIIIHGQDRHVLDVFTGATIRAPPLQSEVKKHCRVTCGVLTAPVTSPESRLILCISFTMFGRYSLMAWHVGSRSWSEAFECPRIDQVIQFNGQLIARDNNYKLYVLSVVPELRLDKIISASDDAVPAPFASPWLVACGDMLVMVERVMNDNLKHQFNAYRLDRSAAPAKWLKLSDVGNYTLFSANDIRSPKPACESPGVWGGSSNRVIYAHELEPALSKHEISDEDGTDVMAGLEFRTNHGYDNIPSFWLYPSFLYS
jgi:hypothetical protein